MVSLNHIPEKIILIVVTIMVIGAGMLAFSGLQDTQCDNGVTSDGTQCLNSTGGTAGVSESGAFNVTSDGLSSAANFTGQFPVIGTIIGVAVLISIVLGAFMFGRDRL